MKYSNKPLVVDLDGTLIKSDLLLESFLLLLKQNILYLLAVPVWLMKGKAALKAEIAQRVEVPVELLPYNVPFLNYIKEQKTAGRVLILATASNERYANAIAEHLGIFDQVLSSTTTLNMSGTRKRDALTADYGEKQYAYAGNHPIDIKVWEHADSAVVVGNQSLVRRAEKVTRIECQFENGNKGFAAIIKALRVHQWVKNGLVFVPLTAAHSLTDIALIKSCILGFLAFSFCASSVYFLNDLLDLNDDRCHATKKNRPFAAGTLPLTFGLIGAPILLTMAIILCLFLPLDFAIVLGCYYLLTVAYSFSLKQVVMVDVLTLASLYTIRILAGAAVINVQLSFWLLSFSMFIFLSLAIIKRYTELMRLKLGNSDKQSARGYQVDDLELLSSLGAASGYLSVLVFALYINSPDIDSLYAQPERMWPACLILLFWVSRLWIIAHRGKMDDDPIVFALKDSSSLACAILIAGCMVLAV